MDVLLCLFQSDFDAATSDFRVPYHICADVSKELADVQVAIMILDPQLYELILPQRGTASPCLYCPCRFCISLYGA
jgi:hypothetical protein